MNFTTAELENSALLAELETIKNKMGRVNHSARELIEAKNTIATQNIRIKQMTVALLGMKRKLECS